MIVISAHEHLPASFRRLESLLAVLPPFLRFLGKTVRAPVAVYDLWI
jgi:hypothetical protein